MVLEALDYCDRLAKIVLKKKPQILVWNRGLFL
jgi:hypothetical protein